MLDEQTKNLLSMLTHLQVLLQIKLLKIDPSFTDTPSTSEDTRPGPSPTPSQENGILQ